MILINHKHERFQLVLCLKSLLSSFTFLFCLFLQNSYFGLVTVLLFINFYFGRNQISLNPLDHVFVLTLLHLFEVRRFFDFVHLGFGVLNSVLLSVDIVFYMVLLVLLGFETALHFVELLLFCLNLASDQVVLLS